LHCVLGFCHLLLTIETRRNRSGGDWVRLQIQIEFSKEGRQPKPCRLVAGFRYETNSREAGSLLLGLYDEGGKLDHVGVHLNDHGRRAGQLDAEARRVTQAARLYR
jgi:hypothetical protein